MLCSAIRAAGVEARGACASADRVRGEGCPARWGVRGVCQSRPALLRAHQSVSPARLTQAGSACAGLSPKRSSVRRLGSDNPLARCWPGTMRVGPPAAPRASVRVHRPGTVHVNPPAPGTMRVGPPARLRVSTHQSRAPRASVRVRRPGTVHVSPPALFCAHHS